MIDPLQVIPLYQQIAGDIRNQISSGELIGFVLRDLNSPYFSLMRQLLDPELVVRASCGIDRRNSAPAAAACSR